MTSDSATSAWSPAAAGAAGAPAVEPELYRPGAAARHGAPDGVATPVSSGGWGGPEKEEAAPTGISGFALTGWLSVAFAVSASLMAIVDLNSDSDVVESFARVLMLALVGGVGAWLLRPPLREMIIAGGLLLVAALVTAFVSEFTYESELMCAAAVSGWLLLRGRPLIRQLFVLVAAVIANLLWYIISIPDVFYEVLESFPGQLVETSYLVIPVVVTSWLATIGLGRPRPEDVTRSMAIGSLVLAVLHLSVIAIVLGHLADRRLRERPGPGDSLALAGLIIGYVSLPVDIALLVVLGISGLI